MGGERGKILVVDDEPSARYSLEAVLADDYDVVCAASAFEAERLIAVTEFDLVITDYQMPQQNGLTLARKIHHQRPEVVVIVLTGHTDEPEVRLAQKDDRIFEVLHKPYDPEVLLRWVRNAVKASQLRKATQRLPKRRPTGNSPKVG